MSGTKIVVVDMVNGFVKEGPLHDEKIMDIVPNINTLIENRKDADIIVLEDCHEKGCAEFNTFPAHCIKGTAESKTIDELQYLFDKNMTPNLWAVVRKNSTNGFFEMHIHGLLRNTKTYIITGCCTDICVLQLALNLKVHSNEINSPVRVIVLRDCVSTYNAPNHNKEEYEAAAFKILEIAGVEVLDLKDVLN